MMVRRCRAILLGLFLFGSTVPLAGHHSVTAYYDTSRQLTLQGPIVSVEWTNPHAFVNIDVRDEHGGTTKWAIETDSPNVLSRAGWTRSTLHPGDQVTATGYPSKKGTAALRLVTLSLADGRKLKG